MKNVFYEVTDLKKCISLFSALIILLSLSACSNTTITTLQEEKKQLQDKVNSLSSENKQLTDEIDKLKNGANALYQQAIDDLDSKNFGKAYDEFNSLMEKFPLDPLTTEAKNEINSLMQLQTFEYNGLVSNLKNEKDSNKKKELLNTFLSTYPFSDKKTDINKMLSDLDTQIKTAQEEANKPPLSIVSMSVESNSAGTPEATVIVKNASKKTIDGFKIAILCFDNYNTPVNHYLYDTNVFNGISQNTIKSGQESGYNYTWAMYGYDNTTKIKVVLQNVHYYDDTTWENLNYQQEIDNQKNKY